MFYTSDKILIAVGTTVKRDMRAPELLIVDPVIKLLVKSILVKIYEM